jgi:DNA-binding XRE family transcriptional regulator
MKDNNAQTFKNLRLQLGLSQNKAAQLLDISKHAVISWENGRNPCHQNYIDLLKLRAKNK